MKYLRQNTAVTVLVGPFPDPTTGAALTTVTIQAGRLGKNGIGSNYTPTSWAHDYGGHYLVGLATGDTDTLGRLRVAFTAAGYLPVWEDFSVLSAAVFDWLFGTTAPLSDKAGFSLAATQAFNNMGQTTKLAATLAAADVSGNIPADLQTIKGQTVTAAAGVTFPAAIGTSTYAGGNVTVGGYAAGQDPAALLFVTPANKLATDGTGKVGANNLPADYQQRNVAVTLPTGTGAGQISLTAGGVTLAAATHTGAVIPTVTTVTGNVTVGTNTDKAGYALAATGLDQISVADPGGIASQTTLPRMLVALWRRAFKKSTLTATQLKTYADDGATINTTQATSDDGTTQTLNPAT